MPAIASNLFVSERGQVSRDIRFGSGATCNRRHYHHCVAIFDRRVAPRLMTDVFVVDVDVNETAECLLVVVKMPPQLCVDQGQPVQSFSGCRRFNLNTRTPSGKLTKRYGNSNRDWHSKFLSKLVNKILGFDARLRPSHE